MARSKNITEDQKAQLLQMFVRLFGKYKPFGRGIHRKPVAMAYSAYEWLNCTVQLYFYEDGWIVCHISADKYPAMNFEGRSFNALKKKLARFAERERAALERELAEKNQRLVKMISLQNFALDN